MAQLSVLLPTYNEEHMIVDCLESVKWADEILVVDSYSTDRTLEIARTYGARIVQHEYINSAKQKNWAIPQCSHPWVFQIDSDERMEPSLREEIRSKLSNTSPEIDGYVGPTKNHILGKWIKTMDVYPGYRLRLFRRDHGRFEDKEVDARVVVPGKLGFLKNHVLHFGMENLARKLGPLDRYTRYEADEREKQGRLFSGITVIGRPIAAFLYLYVYRLGFLDGMRGLIWSAYKANFLFWTYAKLWEREVRQGRRR